MHAGGATLEEDFRGTARFEVRARLGEGGMGVVYHAFDRQRGGDVALKTLRYASAASIYHLKQEFRSLAGLVHPNLVRLHELAAEGDRWFLTMELVRGVDFLAWVRPRGPRRSASVTVDEEPAPERTSERTPLPSLRLAESVDVARLREALRQLAEGIATLHAAGKLHRDLKPSNVMVREDGRVVILDFGLAAELDDARDEGSLPSLDRHVIGTPEYMSPEQAESRPLGPASDWYAFGVMLFEALTGGLPFFGAPLAVLQAKASREAEPPSRFVADVPEDLDRLCADLLRRDPFARPDAGSILRRLGAVSPTSMRTGPGKGAPSELLGRAAQLAVLRDAYDGLSRGRTAIVHLEGESGAGKSALLRTFLDEIATQDRTLVLAGRCYERESVPYKALDPVIDALSRHLRRLGRLQAEAILPRDVLSLARLFPVLQRTDAIARAPRLSEPKDPQELRKRAFQALRELFARIGDRRPLVVAIDDLQWADEDSARLLNEVLRPPNAPRVMLVAAYRRDDADRLPALRPLRALEQLASTGTAEPVLDLRASSFSVRKLRAQPLDVRTLSLEPLATQDAQRLARRLLADDPDAAAHAHALASESLGNPLLLVEFVHFLRGGGDAEGGPVTLERVIAARLRALPDDARRLIEIVCVAARPLATSVAASAASADDAEGAAALLRAHHLARTAGGADSERLEPYHDRIREAVVATLSESALRDRHRRLARAFEVHAKGDYEALCVHFAAGGEPAPASLYAERAAEQSTTALAFDRAVSLLRRAIELRGEDADPLEVARLHTRLGEALANAGRGLEAAQAFLRAGEAAEGLELLELRRKAAQQLLGSGHVDEALEVYAQVLGALGVPMPPSPKRALAGVWWRRLHVALRGLEAKPRAEADVPRTTLARVDAFWTLGSGLSMIDTVRGADFHARHLLAALDAGEPYRVARAIGAEACFSAILGSKTAPRTAKLLARARGLVADLDAPHAIGVCHVAEAYEAYHQGRFREALARFEQAAEVFRDRCVAVAWELANVHVFMLGALAHLGELREISARLPTMLEEADARGDRFAHVTLRIGPPHLIWLAHDDAEGALRDVDDAMARWTKRGFHLQHYYALVARAEAMLHLGDAKRALALLDERWPALDASLLLRIQRLRIEARSLRGRVALATKAPEGIAIAERDARAIEREGVAFAKGFARVLRAGVAHRRGDEATRVRELRAAASAFDASSMSILAAAAMRRVGKLVGGDEGRTMIATASARMTEQEVVEPSRLARTLVG